MAGFSFDSVGVGSVDPTKAGFSFASFSPPADPRRVQDIGDAIIAGLQGSSSGLIKRGKLADKQLDEDSPWYQRAAYGLGGVIGDVPAMVVGGVGGLVAGSAVSGPAAPVVGPIGAAAGAFAAPMAIREALMEAYALDHAVSWQDASSIALAALKGGTKGAVIGAATGGAGALVGRTVGSALAPGVGTALSGQAVNRITGGAMLASELTTLTTASAALEGHMPTAQEFMDNAILLGGLKGAIHVAKGLRGVFAETGKLPSEVVAEARADPTIAAELKGETPIKAYHGTTAEFSADAFDVSKAKDGMLHFAENEKQTTAYKVGPPGSGAGRTMEVELLIRNPLRDENSAEFARMYNEMGEHGGKAGWLRDNGYDGIIADAYGGKHYQVLDASQVRSPGSVKADGIPRAYAPLALEERIKASLREDARPEEVRQLLSDPAKPLVLGQDPIKNAVLTEHVVDSETLKGVVRLITEKYGPEIEMQRRGVVSIEQMMASGERQAKSGELPQAKVGEAMAGEQHAAYDLLLRSAVQDAYEKITAAGKIPAGEQTPIMKLGVHAAIEKVAAINAEIRGIKAEWGRAGAMQRALKNDSTLLGEAGNIIDLYSRKGSMQDLARMVESLKDPAQLAKFADDFVKATTLEKVIYAWKSGILSGILTTGANVMGNVGKFFFDVIEAPISATKFALDKAASGDPLTASQFKARAFAPLIGIQLGALDGLKVAAEVWKQKGAHLERIDVQRNPIGTDSVIGNAVNIPFRLLSVQDAFFRTMAESAEAYKLAVDRAVKEGQPPNSAEFKMTVEKYKQNPTLGLDEAAAQKLTQHIQDRGAEAVFSERLGPKTERFMGAVTGTGLEFILPFRRTPANLVSWSLQHVPGLQLLSGRFRADWEAGGERQGRAVARVVTGFALSATAYSLAESGVITGSGLFEKEEGGVKRAAGWQANSFLINGKYYSYQRIEPIGKVIGLAADIIEMSKSQKYTQDEYAKLGSMMVLLFANATVSTTYLSGLANFMQGVTDPERYGDNLLEQYATSLVPKIIGQTVGIADPYKREVDGVIEAIQSQLPFLREKLLPKRDVWGEPVKNDRWFDVTPITVTEASQDKVRTEAMRLHLAIADVPKFVSEAGPFKDREKRIKLTGEERDLMKEVGGKKAMEFLSLIVNAPDWNQIPDFAQAAIYKAVIKDAHMLGVYAALPPDDPKRDAMREKLLNKIIEQEQKAQSR